MKVGNVSFKSFLIGLLTILLCCAGGTIAWAAIPQKHIRCMGCHVTPGEGELLTQYAGNDGCIYCHSSSESSTTYELDLGGGMEQTVTVPVVNYTGTDEFGSGVFTTYLAGGNFYWVAQDTQATDPLGHNVLDIALPDRNLSEAPGNVNNCSNSCHNTLAVEQTVEQNLGSGCQGCHLRPAHHADDSNVVVGSEDGDDDGFYRFLSGHYSGMTPEGLIIGVAGIEDSDWQAASDAANHNEYLGWIGDHGYAAGFYNLGHTMTAFCCGCHGNYHIQNPPSARHPSDLDIPNSGEYADAFGAGGSGTGTYYPDVPVARPSLTGWSEPSDSVALGTDMVMCLSCHRAHGSPYPKILRWDMTNTTGKACTTCHTSLKK